MDTAIWHHILWQIRIDIGDADIKKINRNWNDHVSKQTTWHIIPDSAVLPPWQGDLTLIYPALLWWSKLDLWTWWLFTSRQKCENSLDTWITQVIREKFSSSRPVIGQAADSSQSQACYWEFFPNNLSDQSVSTIFTLLAACEGI